MINIIDVSGYIYRAFFAFPPLTSPDGEEVGAIFGFASLMLRLIEKFPNTPFISAFDSKGPTFRHKMYSDYKANRNKMPESLVSQVPIIKEVCKKLGFYPQEQSGFEADDIIASSTMLPIFASKQVNVISSDKDLMQLLQFKNVTIFDPIKQKFINNEDVKNKFGVSPNQVVDILALMGDSSDNIPGVPGIGPKSAALLVNEFGSLDGLIKNLDKLPKCKRNQVLKENIEKAKMSYDLASLCFDVPVSYAPNSERVLDDIKILFEKYGFHSLIKKLKK